MAKKSKTKTTKQKRSKPARVWTYAPPVKANAVLQMKVTLLGSKPAIWRRLLLRDDASLTELHESIQIAFGWANCHLHEFRIGPGAGTRYQAPPPDGFDDFMEADVEDATLATLNQLGLLPKSKFHYTYDFGDGWEHQIVVERVLTADAAELLLTESAAMKFTRSTRTPIAACIAGERSGPMEDCGGIWGWADLCEIMTDPKHPEHEERKEWLEEFASNAAGKDGFDPERFELKPVNASLKQYLKR